MIIIKQIKNKQISDPFRWFYIWYAFICTIGAGAATRCAEAARQHLRPVANGQSPKGDSLGFEHRDDLQDSITISFRYLDSLKNDHSRFFNK